MVPIARRNLLAEKTRFLVAVGGVAFAVFLIVLIQSLFLGFRQSAGAIIEDLPFQLWVVQEGTFDLYHSTSLLPEQYAQRVAAVPRVAAVQPIRGRQIRVDVNGEPEREFFFAFGQPIGEVGSSHLLGLEALPASGQLVVSQGLAQKHGIEPGEPLRIGGRQFTVIGTTGESAGFRSFSFMNAEDAGLLFGLNGSINYLTVALDDAAAAPQVAQAIEARLPGVDVLSRQEFADRSRAEIDVFTPVLAVVMTIGFVVGAAIISLTIYTATIEKARDFGVMKALGASRWHLYGMVTYQAVAVGLLGFALGVPLAIGASRATSIIVPEFITLFQWQAIIGVLGVVLVMSLAASYLPIHRIARIEPAMVFRA